MRSFIATNRYCVLILIVIMLTGCGSKINEASTITVSAAASLSNLLDEVISQFEAEHDGIHIRVNYGSSGSLQNQIEQGAPIDVFISAGQLQIDKLAEKELIEDKHTSILFSNKLVVIEPYVENKIIDEHMISLEDIFATAQPQYIAIGETETVPAGIYAKQALEHQAMWEEWKSRMVYTKDVKEALAFVEQGNADFGIVYASDVISSDSVTVVYSIPSEWHDPILYTGAILKASEKQELAEQFLSFMKQDRWNQTIEEQGFIKVE